MISIQVLVVDTYLVMLPHREFSVLVTSGQPYLKIALLLSEVVMHARYMTVKLDYHLHHCILSSLLDHLPNGALTFMTCNPTSAGGHGYIIVIVDYFTKWAEAMPTLNNNGETAALFFFNHVVAQVWCTTSYSYRSWVAFSQSHDD